MNAIYNFFKIFCCSTIVLFAGACSVQNERTMNYIQVERVPCVEKEKHFNEGKCKQDGNTFYKEVVSNISQKECLYRYCYDTGWTKDSLLLMGNQNCTRTTEWRKCD